MQRSSVEILDPQSMTPSERQRLVDELYAVQRRVFDGVSRVEFARYVVESSARRSRLLVARHRDRAVGYLAFHVFEVQLQERSALVVRLESGYEPEHRKRSMGVGFFAREVLRLCLRHPFVTKHFLGCFVHPTPYIALARLAELWPNPERPTPARIIARARALADLFDLPAVEGDADIRKVGWITRESERETHAWSQHPDVGARMFVARNPSYRDGNGLVIYSKISALRFVLGAVKLARRRLRQASERAWTSSSPVSAATKLSEHRRAR